MKVFALAVIIFSITHHNRAQASDEGRHLLSTQCEAFVFGVGMNERIIHEGSNNQFHGTSKSIILTLGVHKERLDAKVKRIGFMGKMIDGHGSEVSVLKELYPSDERSNGLYDFTFELSREVFSKMAYEYVGAFFVETTVNTYYWLKPNGRDLIFNENISPVLSRYNHGCW